jgi:transcriptional regulator with PAS, ATPase and Fis domain
MSKRREKAFVPVNCGAIPDALFESEFFGHRKGAFTGADRDTQGFFDAAHQGTLFLDEIGELSPVMQVKLLRALEGKGHTPVGDYVIRKPDVRIIAATNRNLEAQLEKGLLREDFFYRINVITITVPPLRDHKEDIPLLIDHFLKFSETSETQRTLPGELLEVLYEYEWPGNVRELQNVLQRCLAGQPLDLAETHRSPSAMRSHISSTVIEQEPQNLREAVEEFEKRFILSILEQNRWHRGKTARMLGVGRKTLFRKMKNLGLL